MNQIRLEVFSLHLISGFFLFFFTSSKVHRFYSLKNSLVVVGGEGDEGKSRQVNHGERKREAEAASQTH